LLLYENCVFYLGILFPWLKKWQKTKFRMAFEVLLVNSKINDMKTIELLKEIYLEGFRNLGTLIVRSYFKLFSWFCFAMFLLALYAFIFRVSTGFAFD
jgi:hypothetical protein